MYQVIYSLYSTERIKRITRNCIYGKLRILFRNESAIFYDVGLPLSINIISNINIVLYKNFYYKSRKRLTFPLLFLYFFICATNHLGKRHVKVYISFTWTVFRNDPLSWKKKKCSLQGTLGREFRNILMFLYIFLNVRCWGNFNIYYNFCVRKRSVIN